MRDIQSVTDPKDLAGHKFIPIVDLQIESRLIHSQCCCQTSLALMLLPDPAQQFGEIKLQRLSPPMLVTFCHIAVHNFYA